MKTPFDYSYDHASSQRIKDVHLLLEESLASAIIANEVNIVCHILQYGHNRNLLLGVHRDLLEHHMKQELSFNEGISSRAFSLYHEIIV